MLDIRVSFSILKRWEAGDAKGAIAQMFKLDQYISQAMLDGRDWHENWSNEIKTTNALPAIFGGTPVENPVCETKYEVFLVPGIQLVGVPDLHTKNVVHEFKSGAGDVGQYEESGQVDLYGVLLILAGFPVDEAWYHHYNTATRVATSAKVWLTGDRLNAAQHKAIQSAVEMREYINDNNVEDLINGNSHEEVLS